MTAVLYSILQSKMEENQPAVGPSDKNLLLDSRSSCPRAKASDFTHSMEDNFSKGGFLNDSVLPPEVSVDRLYPPIIVTENFQSTGHPSSTQYALSNLSGFSKSGECIIEPSRHHLEAQSILEPEVTTSPFLTPTYCSNCKKMFATIEAYTRHEPMHALCIKLFPCLECGKYYRHNTALVIHRRTHTGEKPYGCNECGRRFSARSSLVTHGKIHGGKKMFKCSECGKSFARTDDLFHHQLIHTRERRFTCEDCGKCFKTESELAVHRKAHPMVELFLCSGCGIDFTQYSKLLKHQKCHHQPPPVFLSNERMLHDQ